MAARRHQHDTRVRRFAAALASFVRAGQAMPVAAVADDGECLRHAAELLALMAPEKPASRPRSAAGRPPVHDRAWAHACLLDIALADPDGMPTQASLTRGLLARFDAAGKAAPGETWIKSVVRDFHREAREFELEAAATFNASRDLQTVFEDLRSFLRFRRAKARAALSASTHPELRALIQAPDKSQEAACHKRSSRSVGAGISAHSRLSGSRRSRAM